jgi:uncharacterized membrane protein YgaE (UPF0421/DUF939 family)
MGGDLRTRLGRVRLDGRAVIQTAVAAACAWYLATLVLGEARPFQACVAAVIALGTNLGQRARRTVEIIFGVAVGITIANLLVIELGTGPVQLGLVVALAMLAASVIGGGPVLMTQAAVSAMIVTALDPPTHGPVLGPFMQALVGGAVALVVGALLFPPNPVTLVRRASHALLDDLRSVLHETAAALDGDGADRAEGALLRARQIDSRVEALNNAVEAGRETARLAPLRRRARGAIERHAAATPQVDLAVRNTRVLARAVVGLLRLVEQPQPGLAGAIRDLARSVEALDRGGPPEPVADAALSAVSRATELLGRHTGLQTSMVVGSMRGLAVDLMRAAGLEREQAVARVAGVTRGPQSDAPLEQAAEGLRPN